MPGLPPRFRRRFALSFLVLALPACNGVPGPDDLIGPQPDRSTEQQAKYDAAVARGEVKLGMTKAEVRKAWGPPARRDQTRYRNRKVDRWSYALAEVYFDRHGYVIGWLSPGG